MQLRKVPEVPLVAWGFLFHGFWEILQSPLYADESSALRYFLETRFHCTVGDVFILLFTFLVTSLVFRTRFWMEKTRSLPFVIFVALGLAYTAGSEWFNTRIALSWAYSPAMPRLLGIGLAPLLQWLVVPIVVVLAVRRCVTQDRGSPGHPSVSEPDPP